MFIVLLIISLSIFSVISIYNFFTAPQLKMKGFEISNQKLVSILVPARNEEANIENCLKNILLQDYANTEIIVLDDNSNDRTFEIASSYNKDKIKVINGDELPENWLGKNWACHQLSEASNGEYLLFIDTDVEIKRGAISTAIQQQRESNVGLLSVFPTQIMKTFGEYLIVPIMNWLLLTFLPLRFVFTSSNNLFVAANGQFMLWKRETYFSIGGHEAVKNKVVEDMELAKLCKKNNLKIKTLLGSDLVYCNMYNSFKDAYSGFLKNFYAGFSINPLLFFITILFLLLVFLLPFVVITISFYSFIPLILVLVTRIVVSIKSKQNWLINVFFHPVQMLLMFWIGIVSVIKFETNQLVWKQRKL